MFAAPNTPNAYKKSVIYTYIIFIYLHTFNKFEKEWKIFMHPFEAWNAVFSA